MRVDAEESTNVKSSPHYPSKPPVQRERHTASEKEPGSEAAATEEGVPEPRNKNLSLRWLRVKP